jgi:subtilisin family serine protease
MATFNSLELDLSTAIGSEFTTPRVVKPVDRPDDTLKEYVVIVKEGLTIDQLEIDLERDTSEDDGVDSSVIPDRPINVANRREGSDRQTHYWMTYAEATALKNHPSVLDVELCPDTNPMLSKQPSAVMTADFTKQTLFGTATGNVANYGLKRCSSNTNIYGTGTTTTSNYDYLLDGSGVDIIIMDTGITLSHPEFQDKNGVSRIQQIDWYSVAGVVGTMPSGFYTDTNGHGTATAATAAGKTFGWAKNAKIYVMNTLGAAGTTIDATTAFDLMTKFHQNKTIDPTIGFKRPTIVNMSWGVTMYMMSGAGNYDPYLGHSVYTGYQIWGGSYRGTTWSGYTLHTEYGMNGGNAGTYATGATVSSTLYQMPGFSSSYDASVASMISAGIHVIHASGNDKVKADISTGPDYNNYANICTAIVNGSPVLSPTYYNRPNSPWAVGCINLGATDVVVYNSSLEQRGFYSNYGTSIDLYAPGTAIVTAGISGNAYYANSSFFQINESGTSFSAPQTAGVLALFLQQNPGATPAAGKQWLTTNNQGCVNSAIYDTGLTNDFTSNLTLSGGNNKFLNNPFSFASAKMGENGIKFEGGILTLKT